MSHTLTKEQLLILQDNLPYNAYEKFMAIFEENEESLPEETEMFENKIIALMKEHIYWGEIQGWGKDVYYKRISQSSPYVPAPAPDVWKLRGRPIKEFIEWMDVAANMVGVAEWQLPRSQCLRVEVDNHEVPMTTRWMSDTC
jgi:hypothetical protein